VPFGGLQALEGDKVKLTTALEEQREQKLVSVVMIMMRMIMMRMRMIKRWGRCDHRHQHQQQ
jgi:hypothetical protein